MLLGICSYLQLCIANRLRFRAGRSLTAPPSAIPGPLAANRNNLPILRTNFSVRYLHLLTLFICSLICLDSLYSPHRLKTEKVVTYECNEAKYGRYGAKTRSFITTPTHTYDLSLESCLAIHDGDTIAVSRSLLSNALSSVAVLNSEGIVYDVSFFTGRTGWFYVCLVGFLGTVFFLFFNRLGNQTGRRQMSYFLLVAATALLVQHMFNVF